MSSNQTVYNFENPLNLFAGFLVLSNSTFGSTCNFFIIYIFLKENDRSSFNLMCLFRASINLYILVSSFTLDFVPVILTGTSPFPTSFETANIVTTNSLYLVNEYQTILVSVNRFISMYFPLYYNKLCGFRTTLAVLLVLLINRLIKGTLDIINLNANDCKVTFSSEYLTWLPTFEFRCQFNTGDLVSFTAVTFALITIVNALTFCKIIRFYMTSKQNSREARKKIRKNIVLFFQTILQDSLYIIDLTFTFKLSTLSDARYWSFISSTFIWQCLHSFDGLIMIMFNERLSFIKRTIFAKSSMSVSMSRSAPPSSLPVVI